MLKTRPSVPLFSTRPLAMTMATLGAVALHGQEAAPQELPSDPQIVELSPFEVNNSKDVGYVANDTLAGSRLRTKLSDVANAISVFTPEFMNDLNAFGEADLMRYSASAVPERTDQTALAQGIPLDTGGFQFRIRGQQASRSRDYFGTALVPDTYNAERFEAARGPNAILFGLGGAGGILNTSIKTAKTTRTFTDLAATAGSNNLLRTQIDHNQKLSPQMALRLNAVYQNADGWQAHQNANSRRMHLAGTYRPCDKVTFRVEAEFGHNKNTLSRFYAPFDNVSLWKLSGSPLVAAGTGAANAAVGIGKRNANQRVTFVGNDGSFHNFQQTVFSQPMTTRINSIFLPSDWAAVDPSTPYLSKASFSGPGGTSEFTQKLFGATVEMRPVKNLSVELAAISDLRDQDVFDTTHEAFRVLGEPGSTYRDGEANPNAGSYYVDTRWVQRHERNFGERFRGTLSYTLELGRFGRHNFAGMASRDLTGNPRYVGFLVLDGAPFHAQPQNAVNQIWTRQYVTNPSDISQWAAPDFRRIPQQVTVTMDSGAAPRTFNTAWAKNELNDQWQHNENRFAALQSYFMDERIVTTVGYRYTRQASFSRPTNATLPSFTSGPLVFTGDPVTKTSYDFDRISYGLIAKPLKWVSLYCNYSENAQIPGSTQTLIPDSRPFPLNSGEGTDYGIMMSFLQGKIFVRTGYFTTSSVNQSAAYGASNVAIRNDRIMDAMLAAGVITSDKVIRLSGGDFDLADIESKGYEFNLTANPATGWRVMLDLSHSTCVTSNMLKQCRPAAAKVLPLWQQANAQTLVTSASISVAQEIINYQNWLATTTAVEGSGTVGHRKFEARAYTRYEFQNSILKGVFVGCGLSYGSSPVIGRSTAGELFYAPIRREADLLAGYRTKAFGRREVEFQLNVNNILQQSPYTLMNRQPDGQLYRAQLNAPTSYTFSTRVRF